VLKSVLEPERKRLADCNIVEREPIIRTTDYIKKNAGLEKRKFTGRGKPSKGVRCALLER